jgi:hypothetical protein
MSVIFQLFSNSALSGPLAGGIVRTDEMRGETDDSAVTPSSRTARGRLAPAVVGVATAGVHSA